MANYKNLEWDETVQVDESIEEYEYRRYPPNAGGVVMLNEPGEIMFTIESGDTFTHPHNSYLRIQGKLIKADDTRFDEGDLISLSNNAIMYLFSNIKYLLGGQEIESLIYPGQGTTMLGLLEYSDDFSVSKGLNFCWFKDSNNYKDTGAEESGAILANSGFKVRHDNNFSSASIPEAIGNFSFNVPLSHIFGFCKDYDKIIYGIKHELILTRKVDNEPIFSGVANLPKLELSKIHWCVPIVKPSIENLNSLLKSMEKNIMVKMGFSKRQFFGVNLPQNITSYSWSLASKLASEKPRVLVVGFQQGNKKDMGQNPSIFNNLNVQEIHVFLNNTRRYPALDYEMNFGLNQISDAYDACSKYKCIVDGIPNCISNGNINPIDFKTLYPLFVIDMTKQPVNLKSSIINITVEMKFRAVLPANVFAHGALLSDKVLSLQADGKELKPVY